MSSLQNLDSQGVSLSTTRTARPTYFFLKVGSRVLRQIRLWYVPRLFRDWIITFFKANHDTERVSHGVCTLKAVKAEGGLSERKLAYHQVPVKHLCPRHNIFTVGISPVHLRCD